MRFRDIPIGGELIIKCQKSNKGVNFKTVLKERVNGTYLIQEITDNRARPLSLVVKGMRIDAVHINRAGQPFIWKDVKVKHISIEGKPYHRIVIYSQEGEHYNMRKYFRLTVNQQCDIAVGLGSKAFSAFLVDVSLGGFGFTTSQDIEDKSATIYMQFIRNGVTMNMKGKIVRQDVKSAGLVNFGCVCMDKDIDENIKKLINKVRKEGDL